VRGEHLAGPRGWFWIPRRTIMRPRLRGGKSIGEAYAPLMLAVKAGPA